MTSFGGFWCFSVIVESAGYQKAFRSQIGPQFISMLESASESKADSINYIS